MHPYNTLRRHRLVSDEQKARENRNEVFTAAEAQKAGFTTRNVMKEDFDFEIPTESIPLPSNGTVYPGESSLAGKETLDIKSMTAKEEDILTSRTLIKILKGKME